MSLPDPLDSHGRSEETICEDGKNDMKTSTRAKHASKEAGRQFRIPQP
jgi:hypothetical protein